MLVRINSRCVRAKEQIKPTSAIKDCASLPSSGNSEIMGVTCGLDFNVLRKPSSILIASFRKCQDKGGRSLNESKKN